jgi:hypothetical protein
MAATLRIVPRRYTFSPNCGCDANRPAVTSRESPGRKKPTTRPVSAKMMAVRPT